MPGAPTSVPGMDITEVILEQHHEQRRMFAVLDEMPRGDTAALGAVWARLEVFLEVVKYVDVGRRDHKVSKV